MDIGQKFFFSRFYGPRRSRDPKERKKKKKKKKKKERGQYPGIFVNKILRQRISLLRKQSGQSRAGKIARVANQNTGFTSSNSSAFDVSCKP